MADTLPDIKPIRTGFLINAAAVLVCLILVYFFGQQELRRMSLSGQVAEYNQVKAETGAVNSAQLRKSTEFINQAKKLQDLSAFYGGPVTAYDFLLDLAGIRPEDLIFDSVNFTQTTTVERRRQVTTYQLTIGGETKNLTTLDNFKAALNSMKVIQEYNGSVDETILQRDEDKGVFPYRIQVNLTPSS